MEVCLRRISRDSGGAGRRWTNFDLFFVRPCLGVYKFDPSDLRLSSSATVVALVRYFYGVLVQRLLDCLTQQGLPSFREGGAMTTERLRLALVFVVVARWSTDMVIIFITSVTLCTVMIENE